MSLSDLWAVLLTGLLAGGLSCAAVQGGLLTALVARQRGIPPALAKAKAREAAKAGKRTTPPKGAPTRSRHPKKAQDQWHNQVKVKTAEPPAPLGVRIVRALKSARACAADDFAPVTGFLTGKLLSHALLGLLLGALGSAVQFSATTRALAQIGAGILIIVFALAQLGVRGFRNITITPPASLARFVRGRTKSQSALAPAILGFFTVLIPCGVTLSVMALAVTTQSPLAGAVTMAVFVIGTSPLFAVIGYAARKATGAWQGRLATATGLVILGVGLWTLNGGLTVVDSPLAAANLTRTLGFSAPPATASTVTTEAGRQTAVLTAVTGAYTPANIQVTAGVPTTLTVRAQAATGCVRAFIIRGQQYILPETGDTNIDLGVLEPGELRFRCSMGMYTGRLTIIDPSKQGAPAQ